MDEKSSVVDYFWMFLAVVLSCMFFLPAALIWWYGWYQEKISPTKG